MDDDTSSLSPAERQLDNAPSIDALEPMESSTTAPALSEENTVPSKRQLPGNEQDSQQEDLSQSASTQPTQSQDAPAAGAELPGNSGKRRRISVRNQREKK